MKKNTWSKDSLEILINDKDFKNMKSERIYITK